jgi:hypothetical protein
MDVVFNSRKIIGVVCLVDHESIIPRSLLNLHNLGENCHFHEIKGKSDFLSILCKVLSWNDKVDSSVGTETNTDENSSSLSVNSDEEMIN